MTINKMVSLLSLTDTAVASMCEVFTRMGWQFDKPTENQASLEVRLPAADADLWDFIMYEFA